MTKSIRPTGFELLLQRAGLTHNCEQGGTKSGTIGEDSRLGQMLEALSSLTESEREVLADLLQKMG